MDTNPPLFRDEKSISDYKRNLFIYDQRRKESSTSVFKTKNSISNPSGIPFLDRLETELFLSKWRFFYSVKSDIFECFNKSTFTNS